MTGSSGLKPGSLAPQPALSGFSNRFKKSKRSPEASSAGPGRRGGARRAGPRGREGGAARAQQPAPSPGADLELFNGGLEVFQVLPALLALGRVLPVLHRSLGVCRWVVRLPRDSPLEGLGGPNLRPLPWRLLGNRRARELLGSGRGGARRARRGGLWSRLRATSTARHTQGFPTRRCLPGTPTSQAPSPQAGLRNLTSPALRAFSAPKAVSAVWVPAVFLQHL